MKKLILAAAIALASVSAAQAASLSLFGGTGQVGSGSLSTAGAQGGSGSIGNGLATTNSTAGTVSGGEAQVVVAPNGIAATQNSFSLTGGNSTSGSLGSAVGGSVYGGGGLSGSGATGNFGTIGVGILP